MEDLDMLFELPNAKRSVYSPFTFIAHISAIK